MELTFDFIGKFVLAGGGLAAMSYGLFRVLGDKWLEAKFGERLQNLKAAQDRALRHVQSTIDREVHRAKKLYDSEFTALSECWRLGEIPMTRACRASCRRQHKLTGTQMTNLIVT